MGIDKTIGFKFKLNYRLFAAKFTNMGLKIIKALWFVSVVASLLNLLYVFASIPEEIVVQQEGASQFLVGRDSFFYIIMVMLALINGMVYIFSKAYAKQESLRTWFYSVIISINIFFIISLSLISLYNSTEKYDYARISIPLYGSLGLVVIAAISWPLILAFKRISAKSVV